MVTSDVILSTFNGTIRALDLQNRSPWFCKHGPCEHYFRNPFFSWPCIWSNYK